MKFSGRWFRVGGVIVALVGFGVTRLFVVEAVRTETVASFLLAGVLPLLVGLGVTLYGVGLTVGAFSREYVTTVARWCLVGTVTMVLILVVTSLESLMGGAGLRSLSGTPLLVANVLLGGTVGGALIGHRSATGHRQRRQIRRQANRALLLDRLLRDEVINAVAVVRGHAGMLPDDADQRAAEAIENATEQITTTIDKVGRLIEERETTTVDVAALLSAEVDAARSRFPDVDVAFDGPSEGVEASVDDRLEIVVRELLENAAQDEETTRVGVELTTTAYEVRVSVEDDGSGLPERQRELLTSGQFPTYDDPSSGFGLQIVRLLVLEYGGQITVDADDGGTTITLVLPRVDVGGELVRAVNVSPSNLYWATVTGLFAGVVMGAFFVLATNVFPVIGALYGVRNPIVGLVTHLFHSVVFAFVFAGVYSHPTVERTVTGPLRGGLLGVAWGTALWLVAAGVIMPLWLRSVGVTAMLPNLPTLGFVSHAIWGSVLGVSYALLRERPVPFLR